jgi:hypothetical protein
MVRSSHVTLQAVNSLITAVQVDQSACAEQAFSPAHAQQLIASPVCLCAGCVCRRC